MTTINVRVGDVIKDASDGVEYIVTKSGRIGASPVSAVIGRTNEESAYWTDDMLCHLSLVSHRRVIGNVLDLARVTAKWPKRKGGG